MDRYITHQVSQMHTDAIIKSAGIDSRSPQRFIGNIEAVLPITLARKFFEVGDRVLTMGVDLVSMLQC